MASSFMFVATTLVLLHLNQPHFAFGRVVPQAADPPLTTFPCFRGRWCPWPWPTPPAKPSPNPVPATPEEPKPVPAAPEDPKPVPAAPEEPKPVPAAPEEPKPVPAAPEEPVPVPAAPAAPSSNGTCEVNYGACVSVFKGLMHWEEKNITAGTECCSLFGGLIGYQSAWCLCHKFKGEFFGFKFEIPIAIDMTVNFCNKKLPTEFKCA